MDLQGHQCLQEEEWKQEDALHIARYVGLSAYIFNMKKKGSDETKKNNMETRRHYLRGYIQHATS